MAGSSPYDSHAWRKLIPDIDRVIADMERVPIMSVGITPFTRVAPSFFLRNYSIYTIKRSTDVDILQSLARMYVLEDFHPDIAARVHGTGYLIGNYVFQSFLKSRRPAPILMITTINDKSIQDLANVGIRWIGNAPKTFENVLFKGPFRRLLKSLGLSGMPAETYTREAFIAMSFDSLWQTFSGAFVVQRGDKEVGGNEGTYFIRNMEAFAKCIESLSADDTFKEVVVSPFVKGHSVSMLGCVTAKGTLTGPLQLQFIDVPQALNGVSPSGIFFGNDIGFHPWSDEVERGASRTVKGVGDYLAKQGYKGIFGIDFLYDEDRKQIFANECNPRFTGSLTLYSLMLLEAGVPPLEFFHILTHLDIESSFDFDAVDKALKTRIPCAHIAFSPKGIKAMKLPILAGVYSYEQGTLVYKGPGMSLYDLRDEHEFLLIDTVPSIGDVIEQNVPRLFKFIFKRSIARSSHEVDAEAGLLVEKFASALRKAYEESLSDEKASR